MIKALQVIIRVLQVGVTCCVVYKVLSEWRIQRVVKNRMSVSNRM